jgi:hypothetical protein
VTSRRANGEGSIFPHRNGFAAYVWITTPSGKRQRKYVYGRTREKVHSRWVELTQKAPRGPVITKVPTVGQFLHRWLEDTVAPNLAPLTYATYESHVKNYVEPGIGACGSITFASPTSRPGSIAWPHNASAARRERTSVGYCAVRHGAAHSGSAVIRWCHRAQSRTLGPSCVQRSTRQSVKN